MTLGAEPSLDPIPTSVRRPAIDRLDAAFWIEECRGRKLAFKLRLIAAGVIAILLLVITPPPQGLYYHPLMLGFVGTRALAFIPPRLGPGSGPAQWGRRPVA